MRLCAYTTPRVEFDMPLRHSLCTNLRQLLLFLPFTLLAVICCPGPAQASQGFQPVSPDELKMTSESLAPGAPAIILYRQVDRDDNGRTAHEDDYYRIKILTEEGRKYANIEIPFVKGKITLLASMRAPSGPTAPFGISTERFSRRRSKRAGE